MKFLKFIIVFVLLVSLLNCASSKPVSEADKVRLKEIINNRNFTFNAAWTNPRMTVAMSSLNNSGFLGIGNNLSMVNIQSDNNYIKFKNDTIIGYLAYFGERQFGSSYSSNDISIKFNDVPSKFKIKEGKKNAYEIFFEINADKIENEIYTVYLRVFPSMKASISLMSSNRTGIEYTGSCVADK